MLAIEQQFLGQAISKPCFFCIYTQTQHKHYLILINITLLQCAIQVLVSPVDVSLDVRMKDKDTI